MQDEANVHRYQHGPLFPMTPGKSGKYLIVDNGVEGRMSWQVRTDASLWTQSRRRDLTNPQFFVWNGRAWAEHTPVKPAKKEG